MVYQRDKYIYGFCKNRVFAVKSRVKYITRENHRLWRWSTSLLAGGIRAMPESSRRNKRPPPAVREYGSMHRTEADSSISLYQEIRELLEALFKGS